MTLNQRRFTPYIVKDHPDMVRKRQLTHQIWIYVGLALMSAVVCGMVWPGWIFWCVSEPLAILLGWKIGKLTFERSTLL